ncbi:MAG: ABC transporter permease [Vicinamibacterales bacterium]
MKSDRGGARAPIVELTLSRLREFVREPEAMFWTFVFPILMAIALALAFPGRTTPVLVAIAGGAGAETVRSALADAGGIELRDLPGTPAAQTRALREGDVHLIVVPGTPPTYRFDAGRSESRTARLAVDAALKRADGREDLWQAREDAVEIPGSRYVDWLIPGLVGMNIMGTGMWGLGFSIVTARMKHLLKRLAASPMRKRDYLAAQMMARLIFLAPEVVVPLAFAALVLGMPIIGGWLEIAVVSIFGALAFGAIGLLAASRVRTIEAISGVLNFVMLPMWIVSGVFFSSANFPDVVQPFVQALPLTALVDALRAVVLDGASLAAIGGELALLAAWTGGAFAAALALFRWR